MASAFKYSFTPLEDYLAEERETAFRSEYVNGQIYAVAGASRTHNTIATSITTAIDNQLRDGCRVWQSDMKVLVRNEEQYFSYYPDIMAACGNDEQDEYVCTKPLLIVEVLSNSTERHDLKEKFDNYIAIPSLLEYMVVSQDVPLVRLFRRQTAWECEFYRADDVIRLESVDLSIPVQSIYRRVRREVGLDIAR